MSLRINSEAPNFQAETTQGPISFHDWIGSGWAILFSHPKDFTPVCTTELGYMAGLKPEFDKRNTKILGLSVDPVDNHKRWSEDIEETQGHAVNYPLIGDPQLSVAKLYDMLPAEAGETSEGRTPADNATVRSVFIIVPDMKIKAMLTYPMSSGRNFDEVLRLLDSCQLTAKHQVATPVNWKHGDDVIIVPRSPTSRRSRNIPAAGRRRSPISGSCRSRADPAGDRLDGRGRRPCARLCFGSRAAMCWGTAGRGAPNSIGSKARISSFPATAAASSPGRSRKSGLV
jgi:alkyl hydroperoxide reductase subunit AhpC